MTTVYLFKSTSKSRVWKENGKWWVTNHWLNNRVEYDSWDKAYRNAYLKTSIIRGYMG